MTNRPKKLNRTVGWSFWADDCKVKFWAETRTGRRVGGRFHAADSDSSAVATWPQNISYRWQKE